MKRFNILFFIFWQTINVLIAQPVEQRLKIVITPDHADWLYKTGEKVQFVVSVMENGNLCKNITIKYQIAPERMDPIKKGLVVLTNGKLVIEGGTLSAPVFLRCIVTIDTMGARYRNLATVGFNVSSLAPTVQLPVDFLQYWKASKDTLATIPLDTRMVLLPERCTEKVDVYEVNIQNYNKSRLYGIVCIPKAPGKYPALLTVPGAGVRSYYGDVGTADKGFITFDIGIHGIPVTMDNKLYAALQKGALYDYPSYNMDDRDRYYYKNVYMGCVRANDFLCSLPQFDGEHLAVQGGSQGGALAIVTGALDPRVRSVASMYPALSDLTGYLYGRAGGWPHFFDETHIAVNNTKTKINTLAYYDVVNFAKQLTVPVKMTWGYNDETCPPITCYAVYNSIHAPKTVDIYQETGRWAYPEQVAGFLNWTIQQLRK